ncbi:unnamed protein product [Calypogeia fissa]
MQKFGQRCVSLAYELANCADHWAGIHTKCLTLSDRPCHHIGEVGATDLPTVHYEAGSPTHIAMKTFMEKYITPAKMKFFTMAREKILSETFHSVMGKYATKRIHFPASHEARLLCAGMDWNENINHPLLKVYDRIPVNTAVRDRPGRSRVLVERTTNWKEQASRRIYGTL